MRTSTLDFRNSVQHQYNAEKRVSSPRLAITSTEDTAWFLISSNWKMNLVKQRRERAEFNRDGGDFLPNLNHRHEGTSRQERTKKNPHLRNFIYNNAMAWQCEESYPCIMSNCTQAAPQLFGPSLRFRSLCPPCILPRSIIAQKCYLEV